MILKRAKIDDADVKSTTSNSTVRMSITSDVGIDYVLINISELQ